MPDQDPPTPPVPPTPPTPPTNPPTNNPSETPGAVVTIEDTRTGSGGGKQENPSDDPNDPNHPPASNRGTGDGGSRSIKVTVQLPHISL